MADTLENNFLHSVLCHMLTGCIAQKCSNSVVTKGVSAWNELLDVSTICHVIRYRVKIDLLSTPVTTLKVKLQ